MEQRAAPHPLYIAFTDIWSAASLVFPIIFLIMAMGALFQGNGGLAAWLGGLAVVVGGIGILVARWRVQHIQQTIAVGVAVEGTVTQVRTGSGRSGNNYLKWQYEFQKEQYEGEAYMARSGGVRMPAVGELIGIWVNPQKPSWSVIRDLYILDSSQR